MWGRLRLRIPLLHLDLDVGWVSFPIATPCTGTVYPQNIIVVIDPQNIDFHEIARRGDVDVMEAFLDAGLNPSLINENGHSLLMIAAYNEQAGMVDLLAARGADVDSPDNSGNTPVMGLCFKGYPEIVARLLGLGADPNASNNAGATALMMAVMFGQREIAEMLLKHGADVEARDASGRTAADIARMNGLPEFVELLEAR